jgi:AraC-like DNA-binding protein
MLWTAELAEDGSDGRELVLPNGTVHMVLQISGRPARLLRNVCEPAANSIGRCVVGGARATPYPKEASGAGVSVGAVFRAGGAYALLVPGIELAHRHTNLEDILPRWEVAELCERIERALNAEGRLDELELYLERKLSCRRPTNPVVSRTISALNGSALIGDVVRELGLSHRYVASTFKEAVGLGPKTYQRLVRFNRCLEVLLADPRASLAELANSLAYSDQAHLTREFHEFSGVTPGEYRRRSPRTARHLPIPL